MASLRCQISMSVDGFVAGPNPSAEQPLGEGGERLHEWAFKLAAWRKPHDREGGEVNASSKVFEEMAAGIGATITGRNMFGGGPGPWGEDPWRGWWGEEPPFHMPVFVLTHHEREPLEMEGGTTFTFVTEGIDRALEMACEAAAGEDVALAGGAEAIQQYLAAGLLDELTLSVPPILLGGGARLFDERAAKAKLEPVEVLEGPDATHLRYRVEVAEQ